MPKLTPEQQEKVYPTEWTSNQPQNTRHIIHVNGEEPAPDMGQRITGRFVDDEGDGEIKEVAIPSLPYKKFIKSCGTVALIPIKSTAHMSNVQEGRFEDTSSRSSEVIREQFRAGSIDYATGESARGAWGPSIKIGNLKTTGDWKRDREPVIEYLQAVQSGKMEKVQAKHDGEINAKNAETVKILEQFMKTATQAEEARIAKAKASKDA